MWIGRQAYKDFEYTYDGLDRLVEAKRGRRPATGHPGSPGPITPSGGGLSSQKWVLDVLGSWVETRKDLTGNGSFADTNDLVEARAHNSANELVSHQTTIGGGSGLPVPLSYDHSGNMRQETFTLNERREFRHDAWNRLVRVRDVDDFAPAAAVTRRHRYNGLHWRVRSETLDGAEAVQGWREFSYNASWQVLAEDVGFGPGVTTSSRIEQVWGARYIDDAVHRRVETGDNPGVPRPYYHITNAQFSTVAIIDDLAVVKERASYDAYGVARHRSGGDVDGDGDFDNNDGLEMFADNGMTVDLAGYRADLDLNRDGTVDVLAWYTLDADFDYLPAALEPALGDGSISNPDHADNQYGYCGYAFDDATQLYSVRFRWYHPRFGRWVQRDPAGYVDGMGVYEYASSDPISMLDALGLSSDPHLDYTWHHHFSGILKRCPQIAKVRDLAQYGWIMPPGANRYPGEGDIHKIWNEMWERWVKDLNVPLDKITPEMARKRLDEIMRGSPGDIDAKTLEQLKKWIALGTAAPCDHGDWSKWLAEPKNRRAIEKLFAAINAAKAKHARQVAKLVGKIAKGIKFTAPILIITQVANGENPVFVIVDAANPFSAIISCDDLDQGLKDMKTILDESVKLGNANIQAGRQQSTCACPSGMDPNTKPLPGER